MLTNNPVAAFHFLRHLLATASFAHRDGPVPRLAQQEAARVLPSGVLENTGSELTGSKELDSLRAVRLGNGFPTAGTDIHRSEGRELSKHHRLDKLGLAFGACLLRIMWSLHTQARGF